MVVEAPPPLPYCWPSQGGSSVVLDVVFHYLSLCYLYINTKIGKNRYLMLD